MQKKNIGVIGCGLWGRNIVRNFYNLGALHTVCDVDDENIKMVQKDYPEVGVTKNFLMKEHDKAYTERTTPSCREGCAGCGAATVGGGVCFE